MEQYTGYKTNIENIINVGNHDMYLNLCIDHNYGLNLLLFSNNTKSPNAPSLHCLARHLLIRKYVIQNFMIEETILYI